MLIIVAIFFFLFRGTCLYFIHKHTLMVQYIGSEWSEVMAGEGWSCLLLFFYTPLPFPNIFVIFSDSQRLYILQGSPPNNPPPPTSLIISDHSLMTMDVIEFQHLAITAIYSIPYVSNYSKYYVCVSLYSVISSGTFVSKYQILLKLCSPGIEDQLICRSFLTKLNPNAQHEGFYMCIPITSQ